MTESEVFKPDFSPAQFDIICQTIHRFFCHHGNEDDCRDLAWDPKREIFHTTKDYRDYSPPEMLEKLLDMLRARKINIRITSPQHGDGWRITLTPHDIELSSDVKHSIDSTGNSILAALTNAIIFLNTIDDSLAIAPAVITTYTPKWAVKQKSSG